MDSIAALRAVVAREKDAAQEEAAGGCDSHGGQRLTLGRVVVHADAHVYELFDARGRLLVACAAKDAAVSEAVFSTLPGLGQATRRYAALPTSPLAATHLGTLRRVGWGGLAWVLVAADGVTELCSLRFALALTAGPVRFALSVPRPSTSRTSHATSNGESCATLSRANTPLRPCTRLHRSVPASTRSAT